MFPIEIWEVIFQYTDPMDLTRYRIVCRCWNAIIERILKETDSWYKKCIEDIPTPLWNSIFEKLYPNANCLDVHELPTKTEIWMSMYRSWKKWQKLTNYSSSITQLDPMSKHYQFEHVTCIATSDHILAVGSSDGYIIFYDVQDLNKEPLFIADQVDYVCDLQFLRDETNIIAVSSSRNHVIRFWDVKAKKLISKRNSGKLVSTSRGYCYIAMNNVLIAESAGKKQMYEFDLNSYDFVALAADGNKILLLSEKGYFFRINLNESVSNFHENMYGFITPPSQKVRQFRIFKPQVAVCITDLGLLGLSICRNSVTQKWTLYNFLPLLDGVPTSVFFYVQLLILGLDSGEVHVYHIKNMNDLESMDFSSMTSKKIILPPEAIISLDIIEHATEQYLIAASNKTINIIKFS